MRGVNFILGMGMFFLFTSTVKADYMDELDQRTESKKEAAESNYSLGVTDEEIKLMAGIAEAEAGNQGLYGKRLVVDVILNRVDSDYFPDTIEKVIYQDYQFSCIDDGAFETAISNISDESYAAVYDELLSRSDSDIVFFTADEYGKYGIPVYSYQDHFFCIFDY